MLDSLSKTMSRSSGIMSNLKEKASTTISSTSSLGGSTLSAGGFAGSSGKTYQTNVIFLDDTSQVFEIDKKARGAQLMEMVFGHLELHEREYFGLLFNDSGGVLPAPPAHSSDVMRWLDPDKPVRKQMRSFSSGKDRNNPPTLYFRVKFYVTGKASLTLVQTLTAYQCNPSICRSLKTPGRVHPLPCLPSGQARSLRRSLDSSDVNPLPAHLLCRSKHPRGL